MSEEFEESNRTITDKFTDGLQDWAKGKENDPECDNAKGKVDHRFLL